MRGAITPENLEWFEPLMTKKAAELIKEGAPVYAVGVTEEYTKTACGALVGYVRSGCFQLISLFVSPEYRRCGYGNLLIGELVEICRDGGIGIEISFTGADTETETLEEFLKYWFFRPEKSQGEIYEITLGEALKSEYNQGGGVTCVHPWRNVRSIWSENSAKGHTTVMCLFRREVSLHPLSTERLVLFMSGRTELPLI